METWEEWLVVVMDQCTAMERGRFMNSNDVKVTILKEEENKNTCLLFLWR